MSEDTHKQVQKLFAEKESEIKEKVTEELEPFLDGIRVMGITSNRYKMFKEAYTHFEKRYSHGWKILSFLLKPEPTGIKEIIREAYLPFVYLGAVESIGNTAVDVLVMLLIANGRDFHIECRYTTPRIKHVTSIKDLEEERVPLTTKLNFLKENGVRKLTSIIDSKLRNAIAHLRFDVKEGEVFVDGKSVAAKIMVGLTFLLAGTSRAVYLLEKLAGEKGWIEKKE